MRKEYDFSTSRKNPYAARLKRAVTLRLDVPTVEYFKQIAGEIGMPYQNLINLFLRDCVAEQRRPKLEWRAGSTLSEEPKQTSKRGIRANKRTDRH